jgi:hypothetical protein
MARIEVRVANDRAIATPVVRAARSTPQPTYRSAQTWSALYSVSPLNGKSLEWHYFWENRRRAGKLGLTLADRDNFDKFPRSLFDNEPQVVQASAGRPARLKG